MNLLKVFITVVITASISILLSNTVWAVDHPWDDNKVDTTTIVGSNPQSGETSGPNTPTIFTRFSEWTRLFFLEIKSVLVGEEKNGVGGKPPAGKARKGTLPFESKK